MRPGDNGHLHIITAVITIIITVARYSAVFHIKNISQDWSLTNICSATSNTNIFLITNIFFPFPLQSCAQTSHHEGWRFYHFHIINCLKMSLSSTRTFDLAEMSSQVQHFNVKTITNIDRLMKINWIWHFCLSTATKCFWYCPLPLETCLTSSNLRFLVFWRPWESPRCTTEVLWNRRTRRQRAE